MSGAVTLAVDVAAPGLVSITRANPAARHTDADLLVFRLIFTERVMGLDPADFEVRGEAGAIGPLGVRPRTETDSLRGAEPTRVFRVRVEGNGLADHGGEIGVGLVPAAMLVDEAGNALADTMPSAIDETYLVDNAGPVPTLFGPGVHDGAGPFEVRVIFDEAVSGFDAADVVVGGGTASGFTRNDSDTGYTMTVTPFGTADVTVSVKGGVAVDALGFGNEAAEDLTVIHTAELALPAVRARTWTAGRAIAELVLPAALNGAGSHTYTLSGRDGGDLPDGLTFDANTRTLSGTPRAATGAVLVYRVTDGAGEIDTVEFTVTVNPAPTLDRPPDRPLDRTFIEGVEIGLTLPEATGGTPPYTYELIELLGTLPAGVTFDETARTLTGTPTAVTAGTVLLVFRATDANGAVAAATFAVTLIETDTTAPTLDSVTGNQGTGGDVLSIADGAATLVFDFSEEVDGFEDAVFTLADAGDASVTGAAVGTVTRPRKRAAPHADQWTAVFTPAAGFEGTATLSVTATVRDTAVSPNAAAVSGTLDLAVDVAAPRFVARTRAGGAARETNADALVFRLEFSEPVRGVDTADFAVRGGAGALGANAVEPRNDADTGSGTQPARIFRVTVEGAGLAGHDGAVGLPMVREATVVDAAGNALANTVPDGAREGYFLDNTGPTVTITAPATPRRRHHVRRDRHRRRGRGGRLRGRRRRVRRWGAHRVYTRRCHPPDARDAGRFGSRDGLGAGGVLHRRAGQRQRGGGAGGGACRDAVRGVAGSPGVHRRCGARCGGAAGGVGRGRHLHLRAERSGRGRAAGGAALRRDGADAERHAGGGHRGGGGP